MITLTVLYTLKADKTIDMWVEDAPYILVKSAESILYASMTLHHLIQEEVSSMWKVKGEWKIVQYTRAHA